MQTGGESTPTVDPRFQKRTLNRTIDVATGYVRPHVWGLNKACFYAPHKAVAVPGPARICRILLEESGFAKDPVHIHGLSGRAGFRGRPEARLESRLRQ